MRRLCLAVLLGACGAGPLVPDANEGTPSPPQGDCDLQAAPAPVRVHAHPGDTVFAHNLYDAPLGDAVVDESGVVELGFAGCGSVTVVDPSHTEYLSITYVAVGEELWPWGLPAAAADPPQHATVQVADLVTGATGYAVSAGGACTATGPGPTFDLPVDASCAGADGMLTIAAQTLPADPVLINAASVRVALADALAAPVQLPAWHRPPPHRVGTSDATNVDGAGDVTWTFAALADGRALVANSAMTQAFDDGFAQSQLAYAEVGTAALVTFAKSDGIQRRRVTRAVAAPLPAQLDFSTDLLPPLLFAGPTLAESGGVCCTGYWSMRTDSGPGAAILDVTNADGQHWRVISPIFPTASAVEFPLLDLAFDFPLAFPVSGPTAPRLTLYRATDVPDYRVARVTAVWARAPRTTFPPGFVEEESIDDMPPF